MFIGNFLKDLISPKKCVKCKKEGSFLCLDCLSSMSNFEQYCYICKKSSIGYNLHKSCKENNPEFLAEQIIVMTHYKNKEIKRLIKKTKYYNQKDIFDDLGKYLGELLLNNISKDEIKNSIFIPSPMYFWKKMMRGYNQTEILAKSMTKITNINSEIKLINKVKYTKTQSRLTRQERLQNLKNVFQINKLYSDKINGKTLIIVDDVISTGTTINEISKELNKYNPKKIIAIAIASD